MIMAGTLHRINVGDNTCPITTDYGDDDDR